MNELSSLTAAYVREVGQLYRDRGGVAAVEFAMVAPVFLLILIATFDLGHMAYGYSVLNGAVQEAARTSSLETGDTALADSRVMSVVGPVLPGAEFEFSRLNYVDFNDVGRPESWNDANGDGTCSEDETYVDENGNGVWDVDIGMDGNGGAGDVVIYEVGVTYEPVFGVPLFAQRGEERTLTATTAVKRNQPFAAQDGYGSAAGVCE